MTYFFENGINQYRTGFAMPEMYHMVLDPVIFIGMFVFGAFVYTAIIVPVLRYLMVRFLASAGVDRI